MDKCREAFERHQADLTDTDYEVLKHHFDNNEQYFGSRYNEGSLYERDWFVWEACWQSRQAELESLQEEYAETELYLRGQLTDRDSKIVNLEYLLEQDKSLIPILNKKLEEKDKRINQALNFINNWWHPDLDQKLFVEALGRALRGEHE